MINRLLNLFILIMITILLTSCGNISSSDEYFNFDNLRVDFSDTIALGMAVNQKNDINDNDTIALMSNQNLKVYNEITETYLVKIDSKGNQVKVDFKNDKNNTVEVPYYLYYFEVVGDYTYLIYYLTERNLRSLNDVIIFDRQSYGRNNHSFIDYIFPMINMDNTVKAIAIHNESGVVFDFAVIFNEITKIEGTYIKSFFTHETGQFISSITAEENTCIYSLDFKPDTEEIIVTKTCSDVDFYPLFGYKNDTFLYEYSGSYYLLKQGESMQHESDKEIVYFFLEGRGNVALIWIDYILEIYDPDLTLLETIDIFKGTEYEYTVRGSIPYIYTVINNKIFFNVEGVLIVYDIALREIIHNHDLKEYNESNQEEGVCLVEEQQLYIFQEYSIISIDLSSYQTNTIYSGNRLNSFTEPYLAYRATGYITISYVEGITTVTKTFDPFTGLEISFDQSSITKETWNIKPLG